MQPPMSRWEVEKTGRFWRSLRCDWKLWSSILPHLLNRQLGKHKGDFVEQWNSWIIRLCGLQRDGFGESFWYSRDSHIPYALSRQRLLVCLQTVIVR